MCQTPIDDMRLVCPRLKRTKARLHLWNHAACNDAAADVFLRLVHMQLREEAALDVNDLVDPINIREEE